MKTTTEEEPEKIEMVIPDFGNKLKNKRESMNLDQEKFASMINEKKSLVHKMESGEFTPRLEVARRIQKILNIKLIELYSPDDNASVPRKNESEGMTLGDLIKIKTRKPK